MAGFLIPAYKLTAQDTSFHAKHRAIYFPYPMYKEHWRSSIGFNLLTTPEDITEEIRIQVPTIDYHVLRRVSSHIILDARIFSQILQNHLSLGPHWRTSLGKHFCLDAGAEAGYWFGILDLGGFNSKASGWLTYPNVSFGFKTPKNLLITFKAQVSYNVSYKSKNGQNVFKSDSTYYNGTTFTLALEQPFYNKTHLTLALSAIRNSFYWQTWSLFYKTDRKIFYPQITVGFIL
jgi:hypothetical protein